MDTFDMEKLLSASPVEDEAQDVETNEEEPTLENEAEETSPLENEEDSVQEAEVAPEVDWEKRFKDTQASQNKQNMILARIKQKLANGEELTVDELSDWSNKSTEQLIADDNPFIEINEKLGKQASENEAMLRKIYPDLDERIAGFQAMFQNNPEMGQELLNTPEGERLMYVLEKGGEAQPVMNAMKEYGNVGNAISSLTNKISELEAKLAEHSRPTSGTKAPSRPAINGSVETSTPVANDGNYNVSNILGR